MTHQRYLDSLEEKFVKAGNEVALAVECRGSISVEPMDRAFNMLAKKYPILRGRITSDEHGCILHVDTTSQPEFLVLDGDEGTLGDEVGRTLGGAASRLVLIRGGECNYVMIQISHALVDLPPLWSILGDLWRVYTDAVSGYEKEVSSELSMPLSPSEILRERWGNVDFLDRVTFDSDRDDPASDNDINSVATDTRVPESYDILHYRYRLTVEETSQLFAAARAKKVSIHALLTGSFLLAQRKLASVSGPAAMACSSVVDLRNRVTPPVGAMEVTNFNVIHHAKMSVSSNGDAISIGNEAKNQIESDLDRKQQIGWPWVPVPQFETPLERKHAAIYCTNGRAVPEFPTPNEVVITDVWFPLPSSRISKSGATLMPRPFPAYGLFTYAGRLNISCMCSSVFYPDDELEKLIENVNQELSMVSNMPLQYDHSRDGRYLTKMNVSVQGE